MILELAYNDFKVRLIYIGILANCKLYACFIDNYRFMAYNTEEVIKNVNKK